VCARLALAGMGGRVTGPCLLGVHRCSRYLQTASFSANDETYLLAAGSTASDSSSCSSCHLSPGSLPPPPDRPRTHPHSEGGKAGGGDTERM